MVAELDSVENVDFEAEQLQREDSGFVALLSAHDQLAPNQLFGAAKVAPTWPATTDDWMESTLRCVSELAIFYNAAGETGGS